MSNLIGEYCSNDESQDSASIEEYQPPAKIKKHDNKQKKSKILGKIDNLDEEEEEVEFIKIAKSMQSNKKQSNKEAVYSHSLTDTLPKPLHKDNERQHILLQPKVIAPIEKGDEFHNNADSNEEIDSKQKSVKTLNANPTFSSEKTSKVQFSDLHIDMNSFPQSKDWKNANAYKNINDVKETDTNNANWKNEYIKIRKEERIKDKEKVNMLHRTSSAT